MSVHPPTSATHRPPPLVAAAETQSGAVLAFAYFISVRSTSYRPQDFPTLQLIFRSADERRPDRDVLTGFRGCEAARVPTAAAFPAPENRSRCLAAFQRIPDASASQGRVRAAMASRRSSCSRRRVSARLSASRRLAKITASAMLLGMARFAGPLPVRVRQASSPQTQSLVCFENQKGTGTRTRARNACMPHVKQNQTKSSVGKPCHVRPDFDVDPART